MTQETIKLIYSELWWTIHGSWEVIDSAESFYNSNIYPEWRFIVSLPNWWRDYHWSPHRYGDLIDNRQQDNASHISRSGPEWPGWHKSPFGNKLSEITSSALPYQGKWYWIVSNFASDWSFTTESYWISFVFLSRINVVTLNPVLSINLSLMWLPSTWRCFTNNRKNKPSPVLSMGSGIFHIRKVQSA